MEGHHRSFMYMPRILFNGDLFNIGNIYTLLVVNIYTHELNVDSNYQNLNFKSTSRNSSCVS